MPPKETIEELKASLPNQEKPSGRGKIFFISFFLFFVIVVGAIYFLYFQLKPSTPAIVENMKGLTDAKTGKPISAEEINRITEEQKVNKQTFVLSGEVVSVNNNIIDVKYDTNVVHLVFQSGGKILQTSADAQEKLITLQEIEKGNILTVVFYPGKTDAELFGSLPVQVKNIKIFVGPQPVE